MAEPTRSPARTIGGVLATLGLVIAMVLLGMALGGIFVKSFVQKTGMGRDQLAVRLFLLEHAVEFLDKFRLDAHYVAV